MAICADRARTDVVHGGIHRDPHPTGCAGHDRLPARDRDRGGSTRGGPADHGKPHRDPNSALDAFIDAQPEEAVEADFRFHRAIAAACNNRVYVDLLDSLGPMMIMLPRTRLGAPTRSPTPGTSTGSGGSTTTSPSILTGDPAVARAAMRVHLANSRRRLEVNS